MSRTQFVKKWATIGSLPFLACILFVVVPLWIVDCVVGKATAMALLTMYFWYNMWLLPIWGWIGKIQFVPIFFGVSHLSFVLGFVLLTFAHSNGIPLQYTVPLWVFFFAIFMIFICQMCREIIYTRFE